MALLKPKAQWKMVNCQTLPTGVSLTLSTTSKLQGSRNKPLLSRIRKLMESRCS